MCWRDTVGYGAMRGWWVFAMNFIMKDEHVLEVYEA
jgi:hypothetical protein